MNFLEMRQELANQLGLDQTQSDDDTLLKRWLNTSTRMIAEAAEWPFLRASTPLILQTATDISTGTATVSAGGTSVTLSDAPSISTTGRYIQFASSDDWYEITAHTAATTALTISPAAISANTAATYKIRKFFYSTSSNVDRILQIRQNITPFQLIEQTREQFDRFHVFDDTTGKPKIYMIAGKDSSDVWQFTLWPAPDAVINMYVEYIKKIGDLSSDSDTTVIPEKWHRSVVIEGGKWQGYDFLDDSRSDSSKSLFFQMIEEMKRNIMPSKSLARVMMSVESHGHSHRGEFPLPGDFPRV